MATQVALAPRWQRTGPAYTGETYSAVGLGAGVEVLSGTTRHAVVTVTRLR